MLSVHERVAGRDRTGAARITASNAARYTTVTTMAGMGRDRTGEYIPVIARAGVEPAISSP
jgi:hypothetical protein